VSRSRPEFRIEPLGRQHDRSAFLCGVEPLDRYLQEQAAQDARKRVAAPFVLVIDERIAGYYTLSSASIRADHLSPELIRKLKLPRYKYLPATLVGRLARDPAFRGQGMGELLLADALKRAWRASSQIASLGVIADAKDDKAYRFYSGFGFLSFPDTRTCLFLPMQTVERLF
jgi:GNAT superfamily N-acetyltransferase